MGKIPKRYLMVDLYILLWEMMRLEEILVVKTAEKMSLS